MKLSAVVLSSFAVSTSAFAPSSSVRSSTQLELSSKNDEPEISRRNMLASGIGLGLTFLVSSADVANAGLLDDFGSDPKSIQQKKVEEDVIPATQREPRLNPTSNPTFVPTTTTPRTRSVIYLVSKSVMMPFLPLLQQSVKMIGRQWTNS